jgi:NDP-sugar pyrophosphorylase family protein
MSKAVILAAGRGTRMGALTGDRPKPMVEVRGKPILEHLLDRLRAAGITEAFIVTGYRAEMIEEHFRRYPLAITFRRQDPVDGTATAAALAREFTGRDDFLLTYGDILTGVPVYRELLDTLGAGPDLSGTLAVKEVDDPWQGAAVYETGGIITGIVEKPPRGTSSTRWNSAGIYAFRPVLYGELARVERSPRGEFEITSAIAALAASRRKIRIVPISGAWRDIGRPEDLDDAALAV